VFALVTILYLSPTTERGVHTAPRSLRFELRDRLAAGRLTLDQEMEVRTLLPQLEVVLAGPIFCGIV
jgi:hypothetical protein